MTTQPLHIIIPAAGRQSRWGKGTLSQVNKLVIPIRGEPLLLRTHRQLDERDHLPTVLRSPEAPTALAGTGIGHSVAAWKPGHRTAVLFGDVVWSDAALDLVLACQAAPVTWFGRSGPGKHGRRHREIFGLSFSASQQAPFRATIKAFAAMRPKGMTCGGWPLYALMQGRAWNDYIVDENFVEIDDETSDFDRPEDWLFWRKLFERERETK